MSLKETSLILVLSLSLVHLFNGVSGRHYSSQDEALKLNEKIKIENRDAYDCVDVYKQPAFDHPLLKNHTIQWKPIALPRYEKIRVLPRRFVSKNSICPANTIPIRRVTKRSDTITPSNAQNSIYRFAVLEMVHYTDDAFCGAMAYISENNPKCESGQASGASIWIQSDLSDQKSAIKVGWTVNPDLYGDSLTRLSISWTEDGFRNTGCSDLMCPGFVQVDNDMMLGSIFTGISIIGGQQYEEFFYIFQDAATSNWWLVLSQADQAQFVGYWPKEIVPRLLDGGTVLYFGGSTMAHIGQQFPPMGTGQFPDGDRKHTNFFRQIMYVNKSNYIHTPYPFGANVYTDNPQCYLLKYDDDGGTQMGHSIYLGGPGGSC